MRHLALILGLALGACGGANPSPPSDDPPPASKSDIFGNSTLGQACEFDWSCRSDSGLVCTNLQCAYARCTVTAECEGLGETVCTEAGLCQLPPAKPVTTGTTIPP